MYLGELAPKNLRGTLGTMTEVFVIMGVFLAQIFSLQAILGNPTGTHGSPRSRGRGILGVTWGPWSWGPSTAQVCPWEWWVKSDEAER